MAIPLREYYSLSRAAELLDCKVEDLIHWASIGGVNIYLSIESGMGYMHFCNENDELGKVRISRSFLPKLTR